MKLTGWYFLLLLFHVSCNDKKMKEEIINIPQSVEDVGYVDSIIKGIDFIPLETNPQSYIAYIDRIIHKDSFYIVIDKRIARNAFVFCEKGKFLFKLKGNNSSLGQVDDIDYYSDQFYVLSNMDRSLQIFNNKGEYRNTIFFPDIYPKGIRVLDGNVVLAYNNYSIDFTGKLSRVCYYHLSATGLTRKGQYLSFPQSYQKDFVTIIPSNLFVNDGKEILVNEFANDTIFRINKENLKAEGIYRLQYSDSALSNRFKSKNFLENGIGYLKENKESAKSDWLFSNSKYLFFSYLNRGELDYYALYDKDKKEIIQNARAFVHAGLSFQLPLKWFSDDKNENVAIGFIDPLRILKDSLYKKALQKLHVNTDSITELSNPILCNITLK